MISKPQERLLVLKERYYLLAKHDLIKAEILYALDTADDWIIFDRDKLSRIVFPALAVNHVSEKLTELCKEGLAKRKKSKTDKRMYEYKLNRNTYTSKLSELGLHLVKSISVSIDSLASPYRELTYETPQEKSVRNPDQLGSEDVNAVTPISTTTYKKPTKRSVRDSDQSQSEIRTNPSDQTQVVNSGSLSISVTYDGSESKSVRNPDQLEKEAEKSTEKSPNKNRRKNNKVYNNITPVKDSEDTLVKVTGNPQVEVTGNSQVEDANSQVEDTSTSAQLEKIDVSPEEALSGGQKNQFYTWEHYAKFTPEDWKAARDTGTLPGKERFQTLVIGAYLLGMHQKHKQDIGLVPGDFNGKYGKLSSAMLTFFTEAHGGDKLKGFNEALDWIKEFVSAPADSFIGKASWPIQMAFNRDMYRQKGLRKYDVGRKRNNTGRVIWNEEQRKAAIAAADPRLKNA